MLPITTTFFKDPRDNNGHPKLAYNMSSKFSVPSDKQKTCRPAIPIMVYLLEVLVGRLAIRERYG